MSRRREHRRNLRVQAAVEALEPRQLMHSGPGLMKAAFGGSSLGGSSLGGSSLGGSSLGGSSILPEVLRTNLGPWGRLRLVDRLETQGDHQFDALGERLTIKFDHWALKHPALARTSVHKPTPLGSGNALKTTTQIASSTPPPQFNLVHANRWIGRVA